MFRLFIIGVLGFIAGAVITYLGVVLGVSLAWDLLGVHDQDGGGAMALGLVIGPFFGIIGGILGAFLLPIWIARRTRNAPPPTEDAKARDRRKFLIFGGAILGGILGHYVAELGFWLATPIQFDSFWKVWVISWLPTIVTLLGALSGALAARATLRSH